MGAFDIGSMLTAAAATVVVCVLALVAFRAERARRCADAKCADLRRDLDALRQTGLSDRAERDRALERTAYLQRDLTRLEQEADELARALEARAFGGGASTMADLDDAMTRIDAMLAAQIEALKAAADAVDATASDIAQTVEDTFVVERRQRFASYRDRLTAADARLPDCIAVLQADREVLALAAETIRSGRLDPCLGAMELEAVASVFAALKLEAGRDIYESRKVLRVKKDRDYNQTFDDAMDRAARRIKDAKHPAPKPPRPRPSPPRPRRPIPISTTDAEKDAEKDASDGA